VPAQAQAQAPLPPAATLLERMNVLHERTPVYTAQTPQHLQLLGVQLQKGSDFFAARMKTVAVAQPAQDLGPGRRPYLTVLSRCGGLSGQGAEMESLLQWPHA
jgi:hypothetical protein